MALSLLTCLLLPPAPVPVTLAGFDVSLFETTTAPLGNVRVVDETGASADVLPGGLQGIELLPLDFVGRTALDQLVADRPRLRESLAAPRIRLPEGRGAIYAFRRPKRSGFDFGYFHVDGTGTASVVFEREGVGPMLAASPFAPKLAVADHGRHLLLATVPEAGGDLFEIDLETGSVELRTAALSPRAFHLNGLALLTGWGLASTPQGLLRFQRLPGAQVSGVSFLGGVAARANDPSGFEETASDAHAAKPDWIGEDIVTSADGSTAAVIAGSAPELAFVYAVRSTGPAFQVTDTADALSGAGFLPEVLIGPTLALAPDGSKVAWRSEGPVSAEVFVDEVLAPVPAAVHVTGDANFTDTLNDSGVITFYSPDDLVVLVGETDNQNAATIDRADLYGVNVADLGSPVFSNLSMTSGDGTAPFLLSGTLETGAGLVQAPDRSGVLALTGESGGIGTLLHVDYGAGAVTPLVGLVKDWDLVEAIGPGYVFAVRRDLPNLDRELYRWMPPSAPALVFSANGPAFAQGSAGADSFAAISGEGTASEVIGRLKMSTGFAESWPPVTSAGPTLDHPGTGGSTWTLALSTDLAGMSSFFLWAPDGSLLPLHTSSGTGFLLPRD